MLSSVKRLMKCCQKNHIVWFSNEFIKGMTHFFQITVAQQSVLLFVFLLENGRNMKDRIDNEGCVL